VGEKGIEIFIILAWKTAGWWGLDRWVLPALGTPWRPGSVFKRSNSPSGAPQRN
jgi:thiosulfate dehydrogenase [quinone] large subunit